MARALTQKQIGKQRDATIERLYRQRCSGIEINIMDISKVFKVGHAAIAAGLDDSAVGDAIYDFVQTIRL